MRTPILLTFATLLALPFAVGAQVYSWKDASGKTIYSDKPPLEKKAKHREISTGSKAAGDQPSAAKPTDGTAPKAAEAGASGAGTAKSPEQHQAEIEARQKLCDNARKRLIQLETSQEIIVTKDEKGQATPLVGEARKTETEAARKDVEHWCK